MSDWYYTAADRDLAAIERAAAEFRAHWSRIRPPFPNSFGGDSKDIDALDFLDYEGIGYPACGDEGAALIWGEVLRKAVGLRWVISYRGDYMLSSSDEDWPRMLIWPFARLFELQHRSVPQFGKYGWAMEQVVVDFIINGAAEDLKPRLFSLVSPELEGYIQQISDREDVVESLRLLYKRPDRGKRRT